MLIQFDYRGPIYLNEKLNHRALLISLCACEYGVYRCARDRARDIFRLHHDTYTHIIYKYIVMLHFIDYNGR